jgi:hypothetical protein
VLKYIYALIISLFIFKQGFSQSNINPDISLIGTFNTSTNFNNGSPDKGKLIFETPQMELFVESYLNPFARAAGNISYEDGEFGVEELYANIVRGLPLDMQIKAGKYLVGFGKLNTVHPHAWPFLNRPLYQQIYFSPEGFNDIGFNFSFVFPTETFYSSLDLGIFKGDGIGRAEDPAASDFKDIRGNTPVFVGRLGSFFSAGDFSNFEAGLDASYGIHAKTDIFPSGNNGQSITKSLKYTYAGIDFKYKYKPDKYTSLTIQGEGILNHRQVVRKENISSDEVNDVIKTINTSGAFIYFDYVFNMQYSVGLKYDYTYGIVGDVPAFNTLSNDDQNKTQAVSGWLGYYPVEETLAIRLGYQHMFFNLANSLSMEPDNTVTLQILFSLGPHKAHSF